MYSCLYAYSIVWEINFLPDSSHETLKRICEMVLYIPNMQNVTERWRTDSGHELHIAKQERMPLSTCAGKHLNSEL
jgi:hypothetical protein